MIYRISNKVLVHSRQMYSTIFALSSGHGKSGVALIRVSGPKASHALNSLTKKKTYEPRKAYLCKLRDPNSGVILDQALSVWFPAPASFTGEDVVEFQVHGGSAVVKAVLDALARIEDLRPAKAGEFTKRAFYSGKLNLTEVEGLADLINAETEYQRRQAFKQLDGDLHRLYDEWSEMLLNVVATIEASIDFSDDVGNVNEEGIKSKVNDLLRLIEVHVNDCNAGERLRSGVQVSIVGKPNVGKSTLLNTLCQRPAAIVSPIAGTTRDTIEQYLDIGGFPVKIVDTAGLRDSLHADTIELEGMKRTADMANSSDLVLCVIDPHEFSTKASHDEWYHDIMNNLGLKLDNKTIKLLVINKCDLLSESELNELKETLQNTKTMCLISCLTRKGLEQFTEILKDTVENICTRDQGFQLSGACLTRPRHRYHLSQVISHLKTYLKEVEDESTLAVQAHILSKALREFGLLTGKVTLSSVHDKIFSEFCIGK